MKFFALLIAMLFAVPASAIDTFDVHRIKNIHGSKSVHIFGIDDAVGTTEEVIWSVGGDYTGFIQTAVQIEVLSGDADDTAAGTGARTVRIVGLDGDFNEIFEILTLNGTTAVPSVGTNWLRVHHVDVIDVGACVVATPSTTCANEGLLTVRVVSAGAVLASVPVQHGHSEMAVFTIPAGYTGYIDHIDFFISSSPNKGADISMWQRMASPLTSPFGARQILFKASDVNGELRDNGHHVFVMAIPEKTDLWLSGKRAGSVDAEISASFIVLLFRNEVLHP